MIKPKMEEALNNQVNAELYSAYLYQSMSAHCASENLPGFANWFDVQVQEEVTHAMKIYRYILERGGKVTLKAIDQPPNKWSTPLSIFEATYTHEQKVTGLINDLVDLAIAEKDHATNIMLQWFVEEQVEEEASADEVLQNIKRAGDSTDALFMIDRELGKRVFTPPTTKE